MTDESARTGTVLLALLANVGVGLSKLVAGLATGSGALLAEAAHSVGDSATEVLLLVAVKRSSKPADRAHPFGYGKERYFWSLMASVAIFVSGAVFSAFQGIHTITGGPRSSTRVWIDYVVLALAVGLEGGSLVNAGRELRRESKRQRRTLHDVIREPEDPTVNSVALEDSAAVIGILVAALGVGLHQVTGSAVWDGLASLTISVLLLFVAFVLARACAALLIGKQADPRLLRSIERLIEGHDEVTDVVDLLTMMTGTGRILVCARVDFVDSLPAARLDKCCVQIDTQLRAAHPEIDEVFIAPASRTDPSMRERVASRYGRPMADPV